MDKLSKIYVAGHRGMVGSAVVHALRAQGFVNIIVRTRSELDLTNQAAVRAFYAAEQPDVAIIAAARVGGIHANSTYPAEFMMENL
ncbi:MAG: GDP-L-fucose synthase, partial [Yoonia sp.]